MQKREGLPPKGIERLVCESLPQSVAQQKNSRFPDAIPGKRLRCVRMIFSKGGPVSKLLLGGQNIVLSVNVVLSTL